MFEVERLKVQYGLASKQAQESSLIKFMEYFEPFAKHQTCEQCVIVRTMKQLNDHRQFLYRRFACGHISNLTLSRHSNQNQAENIFVAKTKYLNKRSRNDDVIPAFIASHFNAFSLSFCGQTCAVFSGVLCVVFCVLFALESGCSDTFPWDSCLERECSSRNTTCPDSDPELPPRSTRTCKKSNQSEGVPGKH